MDPMDPMASLQSFWGPIFVDVSHPLIVCWTSTFFGRAQWEGAKGIKSSEVKQGMCTVSDAMREYTKEGGRPGRDDGLVMNCNI